MPHSCSLIASFETKKFLLLGFCRKSKDQSLRWSFDHSFMLEGSTLLNAKRKRVSCFLYTVVLSSSAYMPCLRYTVVLSLISHRYFSLPLRGPNIWKVALEFHLYRACGWLILSNAFFAFLLHFAAGVRRGRSGVYNENWRPLIWRFSVGKRRRRRNQLDVRPNLFNHVWNPLSNFKSLPLPQRKAVVDVMSVRPCVTASKLDDINMNERWNSL